MPGAYAHITLVNVLRQPSRLEAVPGFPEAAISAVLDYFKFCELGAVSPDYPYLVLGDKSAAKWADDMHHFGVDELLSAGVQQLQYLTGEAQRKGLAWLLGYAAHVVTDVTIHPVVNLKVGPYKRNKTAHRKCELNQDAHIYQRMNLNGIGRSEHLDSGIAKCCDVRDKHRLDPDIKALWLKMMQSAYPDAFARKPPEPDTWHAWFTKNVDSIAEEGYRLVPIARHVAVGCGLTYPEPDEIDYQFINNLAVPGASYMSYDDIFDRAVENVAKIWRLLAGGVLNNENECRSQIAAWNLDTGRGPAKNLIFWS